MTSGFNIFLGIFGSYVASSTLLFIFPLLLHKKKRQCFRARHISHRGGAGERLPNTIPAFRNAAKCGTEMFEIDVQLTRDGKPVVSHDNNLKHVTGVDVSISNCDYEDIPPLHRTLEVTFAKHAMVESCEDGDMRIPLLKSVLEEFPDIPLNIDTKDNNEVIGKTIDMIREFKREHNVVMANFSSQAIDKIHEMAPDLMLAFSLRRIATLLISFYFGLLPFLPLKESFLEIPLPSVLKRHVQSNRIKPWHVKLLQWLLISPALFRHLQKRGIQVYLFVINEEEDFDVCFDQLHVDGVMTDYPKKLQKFLINNPH